MKVYCISDVHSDHVRNYQFLEQLPVIQDSILIIAGDISDDLDVLARSFTLLKTKFTTLFFLPGNHEMWINKKDIITIKSSHEKIDTIFKLCKDMGVETGPKRINENLAILPLLSWYHPSFDIDYVKLPKNEQDNLWNSIMPKTGDSRKCKWDIDARELYQMFIKKNDEIIQPFIEMQKDNYPANIITFSHMLPRRELLPPKEKLLRAFLPLSSGCLEIDEQLRKFKSTIHIFGHTHIDYDINIDGVRYIQNALSTPKEREGWKKPYLVEPVGPKLIYTDSL